MKSTNFRTLAVALVVIGSVSPFGDGECPTTVYSPGLQKALDAFSISDRCFFKVLNNYDLSTSHNERCSAAVAGSVATNLQIDAKGNWVDKAKYIVCEIRLVKTEDYDDDPGLVLVAGEKPIAPKKSSDITTISKSEMDTYLRGCIIDRVTVEDECREMKIVIKKKTGENNAEKILKARLLELKKTKNKSEFNDFLIILFSCIGIVGTMLGGVVVIYTALIVKRHVRRHVHRYRERKRHKKGKKKSSKKTGDTTAADGTTSSTTAAQKKKKKKKKKRKLRGRKKNKGDSTYSSVSSSKSVASTYKPAGATISTAVGAESTSVATGVEGASADKKKKKGGGGIFGCLNGGSGDDDGSESGAETTTNTPTQTQVSTVSKVDESNKGSDYKSAKSHFSKSLR